MITWWGKQYACVCKLVFVCSHVHHTYPGSPIYTHTYPMTQAYYSINQVHNYHPPLVYNTWTKRDCPLWTKVTKPEQM